MASCTSKGLIFKLKTPRFIFWRQTHFNSRSTGCITLDRSIINHPNPEISCFAQKGFSQITNQYTGKALHGLCIMGLVNLNVFYTNTLINMYSKFHEIEVARYVFDKMSDRNESSWNNMVSGYVRAGFYEEAFGFLCELIGGGVRVSGFFVASLLSACERSGDMLGEGVQVHGVVLKVGLSPDVFVGTSILHFYGAYGFASNARKLFEEMPYRTVVSWTSLMVAYSGNSEPGEAVNLYWQMKREASGNENTYSAVISSCGLLQDEFVGYQILGDVIKSGLESNVNVGNSLVSMFSGFGYPKEASFVFRCLEKRDTISWNSIIAAHAQNGLFMETLTLFNEMRHIHNEINSTTLSTAISACGLSDYLKWGSGIQGLAIKLGFHTNICMCNTLIGMYSDGGRTEDAERVFREMQEKDVITWNSILSCYAQDGNCLAAVKVLVRLLQTRKTINFVTFTSALSACSNPEYIFHGKTLHALLIVSGLFQNLIVGNTLVTMYGKLGKMAEASKVSRMMPRLDEVTCNALIGGHVENKEPDEALCTFRMMRQREIPENYITISNVLAACHLPKHGMSIHAYTILAGFEFDNYVQNSLIMMYARCGDLDSSNYIFSHVTDKNIVAWNAIIAANAYNGSEENAMRLLVEMTRAEVDLDHFTFSECFVATARLAMLEEGQQLHGLAIKLAYSTDCFVINSVMDMYGKCGEMDDVLRIVPKPRERSRMSWNILISAFARHGFFEKATETFRRMIGNGIRPDHVTFVSLLSACSHGGLVDQGLSYYNSMTKEYGVPPGIEHCVCIIDLLGRSGRFSEVESFISEMPLPPNDLVWRSLLSACKTHNNLELAKKAAENLLKLDPTDDSAYVLLSNVCASSAKWEDLENVRDTMVFKKIKKKPACSWVKMKNRLSTFGIGDRSHPQTGQIYAKLEELKKLITEAGYVADTSYALQDTDEEQKEHNLWNHSERLALAYALINTPDGSDVKIFKNLRVCGDCHSVYKFVSKIVGRKIVLRDPYRFHHFSRGECSCSDYW
ncbi:hypothetical protein ACFE04_025100 [Oxalis oulophora]